MRMILEVLEIQKEKFQKKYYITLQFKKAIIVD